MQKIVLSKDQIKKILAKPNNGNVLEKALEQQKHLEQHYSNDHSDLIYNAVQPLLTPQKYTKFKQVFKNHSQSLVNKSERHYNKIYSAHGKSMSYDFLGNENIQSQFIEQKNQLFNGISDEKYFTENGTRIAMIEPNSVYLVGSKTDDEAGKLKAVAKHIPLEKIHDIESDDVGIRYIIIKHGKKSEERFFVYDDENSSVWKNTSQGYILDPEFNFELEPHGNSVCPAVYPYNCRKNTNDKDLNKSVLTDSLKNLEEYNIIRTFYQNYKYFSAFGREIKPQTRCTYQDPSNNVKCNEGRLIPIDSSKTVRYDGEKCPSCGDRNTGVMGEIHEIPLSQQANEALVANFSKMNLRIEADTTILKFHKDDITELKQEITNDVIGEGYGQSYKSQAVNQDQVQSNLDDQESNLDYFKSRIENSWQFILERVAEIVAPESEYHIKIKLGDKYFLKTVEQLYDELQNLYKGTSNSAIIQKKQMEILLTENKNDAGLMQRFNIVQALKPFSTFPLSYMEKNRKNLNRGFVEMYDNFDQILSIFEIRYGKIETMVIDETNITVLIQNLTVIFKSILEELNQNFKQEEDGNSNEQESEGEPSAAA